LDPIRIDPVTRIAGDAAIDILFDETNELEAVHLRASGFRGFERLVQGARLENVVPLVSRICGTCSVSHQVAAARAIENALAVKTTETAAKLRELLMLGHLLGSHALSLTMHSLPDLLFPMSDLAVRNMLSIYRVEEDIVRKVFSLRALGVKVVETVGGNPIHPVNILPGGMLKPLVEGKRLELLEHLTRSEPLLEEMSRLIKMLLKRNSELVQTLGDIETSHLSLWKEEGLSLMGGTLRLISPSGEVAAEFPEAAVFERLVEGSLPYTQVKTAHFGEEMVFRVGPLSRLSVATSLGTPLAESELEEIKAQWGGRLQKILLNHAARMIEMTYAWERMVALLGDASLSGKEVKVPVKTAVGTGVGVVESPEGMLAYYVEIGESGRLDRLNILSPLQCNMLSLQESLKRSARQMAEVLETQEVMRNRLEMVVRSYAPCVSCGIH
jgi:F420-non-reducing hydrogenase large subunit